MSIKRIVIDEQTKAKELGDNKLQLDIVAYSLNEQNQKEPDAELGLFVNNNFVQTLISDLQGNIKENLIITLNDKEMSIRLQDIRSTIVSNVKDIFLSESMGGGTPIIGFSEQEDPEKEKYIAQLKLNPYSHIDLPERAKDDLEIAEALLSINGVFLEFLGHNIKNNKKLVALSLNTEPGSIKYASEILQTDEDFVAECLERYGILIVKYLSPYILNTSKLKDIVNNLCSDKLIDTYVDFINLRGNQAFRIIDQTSLLLSNKEIVIKFMGKLKDDDQQDFFWKISSIYFQDKDFLSSLFEKMSASAIFQIIYHYRFHINEFPFNTSYVFIRENINMLYNMVKKKDINLVKDPSLIIYFSGY